MENLINVVPGLDKIIEDLHHDLQIGGLIDCKIVEVVGFRNSLKSLNKQSDKKKIKIK